MKRKAMTVLVLWTLCLLLLTPAALTETRQGIIALEGENETIEETLFDTTLGFSFWYPNDRLEAYQDVVYNIDGVYIGALYSDDYMILSMITEEDAVEYAEDLDQSIVDLSNASRAQMDVYRELEDGTYYFLTLIGENGQYLSAMGEYSLEAAEGNAKFFQRVLDSVTFLSEYDAEFLRQLPGTWTYTAYIEEQVAGEDTPTADLAFLTLEENGTASLDCWTVDGEYAYACEGAWSYRPVPNYGGHLTLLFTWTDNPLYDEKAYSLECVYDAYTESWVENDTLITYLILNPQISCSGVSPFQELYDDEGAALHRDQGPNMRVVKCKEFVSLRETRSTSAKRLAKVPLGALVLAFPECGEENGFILCSYHDEEGYILAEYLEPVEEQTPAGVTIR